MKTIVLYYTLNGATKTEAERVAEAEGAAVCQVTEKKKRSAFSAFFSGCPNAMKRKASKINPLSQNLKEFDRIIIGCPIWAGFPAPAFNAIAELLPRGKEIGLFFCSAGGGTPKSEQGTKDLIAEKGCALVSYRDIKTAAPAVKQRGK